MKKRLTRKQSAPRNVAAMALRHGQYRPKVTKDPNAYTRRTKHRRAVPEPELPPEDEGT